MARGTNRYKYETDNGNIFWARTDNAAALNTVRGSAPTLAPRENITFEFSKNSKMVGCKPRHCILTLKKSTSGVGCLLPPGQTTKRVIVLKPDTNPPTGTEINCNGRIYIVGSVVGEQMR